MKGIIQGASPPEFHVFRSLAEYKNQHNTLSTVLLLLGTEVILTLTLHLTILLVSFNYPLHSHSLPSTSLNPLHSVDPLLPLRPVYPSPILSSPLPLAFYIGQIFCGAMGLIGCILINIQQRQWIVLLIKVTSLLLVVMEMSITHVIGGDQWQRSHVVVSNQWQRSLISFLVTNALVAVITLLVELFCVMKLSTLTTTAVDEVEYKRVEEEVGGDAVVRTQEGLQIHLSRQNSRELLRALSLDLQGAAAKGEFDENVRILLTSRKNSTRKNSISSVATC